MTQYLLSDSEQSQLADLQRRVAALKTHAILQINNNLNAPLVDQFGFQLSAGHVQSTAFLPTSPQISLYDPVAGRTAPTAQYILLALSAVSITLSASSAPTSAADFTLNTNLYDRNGVQILLGPEKHFSYLLNASNTTSSPPTPPGTYERTFSFVWSPTVAVSADSGRDIIHLNGQDVFRGQFYITVDYTTPVAPYSLTVASASIDALLIGQIS